MCDVRSRSHSIGVKGNSHICGKNPNPIIPQHKSSRTVCTIEGVCFGDDGLLLLLKLHERMILMILCVYSH